MDRDTTRFSRVPLEKHSHSICSCVATALPQLLSGDSASKMLRNEGGYSLFSIPGRGAKEAEGIGQMP
jgi:hypothetical protein